MGNQPTICTVTPDDIVDTLPPLPSPTHKVQEVRRKKKKKESLVICLNGGSPISDIVSHAFDRLIAEGEWEDQLDAEEEADELSEEEEWDMNKLHVWECESQ